MTAINKIYSFALVLFVVAIAASTVAVPAAEAWSCKSLTATPSEVFPGEEVKLIWDAPYNDIAYVTVDKLGSQQFARDGFALVYPTETTVYTAHMHKTGVEKTLTCSAKVTVKEQPKPEPVCTLDIDKTSVPAAGGDVVLTWTTENATEVSINQGIGAVALDGNTTQHVTDNTNFVLTAKGPGGSVDCMKSVIKKQDEPVPPACPLVAKDGRTIVNFAGKRLLSNKAEAAAVTSVQSVNLAAGKYDITLVAWDGYNGRETVSQPNERWKLELRNAGSVVATTDATADVPDNVREAMVTTEVAKGLVVAQTISELRGIHAVYPDASSPNSVEPLCAALDIVPEESAPLTCSDVTFSASDTRVDRGDNVTLSWSWNTSRVDSASIDQGIGSVTNNDNRSVSVTGDITYTITIKKGAEERTCPVSIDVETGGGGGGGSSSVRCELDISKKKITAGQEIELSWDTTRATRVVIKDSHNKEILDTNDYSESRRKDYFDGEEKLKPTKDTTYTLTATRGSRERTCKVSVDVTNGVTVTETRNQPLVAGISLTEVPYTGFEAGPFLTVLFYTLLTLWALFVAYLLVVRRDRVAGVALPGSYGHTPFTDMSVEAAPAATVSPAAAYVASATAAAPANLPVATADAPVIGYQNYIAPATEEEAELSALENRAHAQKALLSSDAMRYLIHTERSLEERAQKLDAVVRVAKVTFPTEDGWIVLNLARMEALLGDLTKTEEVAVAADVTPTNSGSLAEAIVTGNVVAAFAMIQNRPMVALADAAADLDAVYRITKGETAVVSDFLKDASAGLSEEKLVGAITALTSAIDGTYTTEAEAVKMAIMKAIKIVS